MKYDLHDLSARMGTGRRCLLVVLALIVMLPISATASTNCGTHGAHAVVQAPPASGAVHDLWESAIPASDDCPHCSPKHCAVAPACGAAMAVVLTAPVENAAMIPLAAGIPVPDPLLPPGLDTQPPTPPPQVSA